MAIAAVRYNNPGNVSLPIQGWSGGGSIVGISGQPGYAAFPDMQTGLAALDARVTNYIDVKGLNTIGQLNSVYAQDGNWAAGVSANSGIGINTPLDTSNAAQMNSLQGAIIKQETGMDPGSFGFGSSGAIQAPAAPSVGSNLPDAGAVTPDTNSAIAQQSPSLDQIYANNAQYGVNYIAPTAGGAGSLPTSNGFDQSSLNSGGATSPDASGNGAVNTQALNAPTSVSDFSNPSTPIAAETPDAATPATQAGSANVAGTWDATGAAAVSAAGSAVAKSDASAASSITSALGGAVKSLTSALNSTSQAAAKTSVQNDQSIQNTGTGWINTLLLNTKDLFQRGMIGFFGLILLLGAALYFAKASANERTA